ncbi:MAG: FecCD family ABC transporter permease [Candidatus Binatia bacterium]
MLERRLTAGRLAWAMGLTVLLALSSLLWAVLVGGVDLDAAAVWEGLGNDRLILLQVRLPRVLLAAMVGGGLAASGAALQPMLRNPLASPDILGVSGGAALAAVAGLAFLPSATGGFGAAVLPAVAFAGACVASLLVYRLSLVGGRLEPYTQVLVGVIFNTFCASLILLIHAVADLSRSHSISFWLMGGIPIQPYPVLWLVLGLSAVGAAVLVAEARALNLMALGDAAAEHLGVELASSRRRVFLASALVVGSAVSLSGIITFVGLIVPHLLRVTFGSDNRLLLPAAIPAGAAFLVACDALARWVIAPAELPVGAITAMAGGPFFIYLLRRRVQANTELGL